MSCVSSASGSIREQRFEDLPRQHHADAHQLVGDRNHPEPAEVVSRDDPDVAGASTVRARHAGEMREDRDVCQFWLIDPQREAVSQECGRPEASISARALTPRARRLRPMHVTVRPSASKPISVTLIFLRGRRRRSRRAWRSSSSSKRARGTCQVCGCGTPGARAKSAKRSTEPSPVMKDAPHLRVKPASRTTRPHQSRRSPR